ncbi:MAG: hypothetical protein ACRDQ4_16925 [Pseudonocardiaceae bacterium]
MGTLRISPSQSHGSVFTVRDLEELEETGKAGAGGGETGKGFCMGATGTGWWAAGTGCRCTATRR